MAEEERPPAVRFLIEAGLRAQVEVPTGIRGEFPPIATHDGVDCFGKGS